MSQDATFQQLVRDGAGLRDGRVFCRQHRGVWPRRFPICDPFGAFGENWRPKDTVVTWYGAR